MRVFLPSVLAIACAATASAEPPPTADAILAENHAAVGNLPTAGSARFEYLY